LSVPVQAQQGTPQTKECQDSNAIFLACKKGPLYGVLRQLKVY